MFGAWEHVIPHSKIGVLGVNTKNLDHKLQIRGHFISKILVKEKNDAKLKDYTKY